MTGDEDKRLAATIKTTLAGALIAATFAVIGVQAVLAVFVMDKRQNLVAFAVVQIVAAILVIGSALLGAKGIATVYKDGHAGTWNLTAGKGFFSGQAIAGILGLLLVVSSAILCGDPKPDSLKEPPDYQSLKQSVNQLQKNVVALQTPNPQPPPEPNNRKQPKKK